VSRPPFGRGPKSGGRGGKEGGPKRFGGPRRFGDRKEGAPKRVGERSEGTPKRFGGPRRSDDRGGERTPKRFGGPRRFDDRGGEGTPKRFGGPKRFDDRGGEGTPKRFGGPKRFDGPQRRDGPPSRRDGPPPRRDGPPPRRDGPPSQRADFGDDRGRRAPPQEGIVWGLQPVLEYLRGKPRDIERILLAEGALDRAPAAEVLSRARDAGIDVERVDRERLNRMSGGGVHQGLVAEVKQYQYLELSTLADRALKSSAQPLLVLLDGVQDPHNLGAIIRSAHALGAQGVIVAKDRAAQVTGSVVKAAAGALAHCPVARVVNLSRALEELRDQGFWSTVLVPEGGQPLASLKLDGPQVLVVGSEGDGVRPLVASKCDHQATIPMEGRIASLNASVSAAIALYEIARQRAAAAPVQSP
jgi:23S rRNA (guanosine2251-2'-O)-methyltransferase